MSPRVPLRLRVPNPPSPFVGRDDDVARLASILSRQPVAIVWGFSGVGKSALVQKVIHDHLASDVVDRTLWLRAHGDVLATLEARLLDLGLVAEPGGLADLLEASGLHVVIDGLERLDDDAGLAGLVGLLSRHGRRSRLVCVCREDPRDPALATCTVRVDPLADDALLQLLQAVAPAASAAPGLVAAARGSPWRLIQLAIDGGAGPAAPDASLLALSPVARGLLSTLAVADVGLPTTVLERATRLPDDDALRGLARRGWLERVGDALHLHHAAVPFVAAGVTLEERRRRRRRLIDALASTDLTAALAQTVVALLQEQLDDEGAAAVAPLVRRLVTDGGAVVRTAGGAARLWALVVGAGLLAGPLPGDLLVPVVDLALDVGDAAVARLGGPLVDDGARGRVALAALRSARGEHAAALALLRGLADGDALADEAVAGRGIALALDRGDDHVAAALIARTAPALQPGLRALLPSPPSWSTTSSPLLAWPTLPPAMRSALLPALGRVLLSTFRVDDALAAIGDGDDDLGTAPGRALAVVRATARAQAGDPDPFTGLEGLAVERARQLEGSLWRSIVALRRGAVDDPSARAALCLESDALALPRLEGLVRQVRAGPPVERERRQSVDPVIDAALADLSPPSSTTLEMARAAQTLARAGGDRMAALELAFALADAMLAGERPTSVAPLADIVEQEARASSSLRGIDEARLWRATASARSGAIDATALAALAQGGHGLLVRRRARVLLGDALEPAPLDRVVLGSVDGVAPSRPAIKAVKSGAGDREWTVDEGRRRVVVGHDVVDLADKGILFGILVSLGRRGGAATREQLQEDVWGERHYHPLRHDNRLKVAVRKLRRLLEDALGDDPLEAGDDGYRLRGRVRFVSG